MSAVECGRGFRPFTSGIPSPRVSLARGAALLMALFALSFWQGIAERLGLRIDNPGRSHLDLRFAEVQERLALRES